MKRKIKVILAMVTSVNGKSTKGTESPHVWASLEDQEYLKKLIAHHSLIVMGRKTYDAAKSFIKLVPGKKRLVITSTPSRFQNETMPGQLEFTDKKPSALVDESERDGYKELLLLGGSSINLLFLQEKLVDELWLTLEPVIFGQGNNLIDTGDLQVDLKLKEILQLNKNGTLLLKYTLL